MHRTKIIVALGLLLSFGLLVALGAVILHRSQKDNDGGVVSPSGEANTMSFQVFFSQGMSGDCSLVEGVLRTVPETPDIARAAVEALLQGPTAAETQSGYITLINQGTELVDLTMAGSTLAATFSSRLQEGVAGSCRVTAIRAQIEQTLKQFATVQTAIVKVQGVPDDEVLQP